MGLAKRLKFYGEDGSSDPLIDMLKKIFGKSDWLLLFKALNWA